MPRVPKRPKYARSLRTWKALTPARSARSLLLVRLTSCVSSCSRMRKYVTSRLIAAVGISATSAHPEVIEAAGAQAAFRAGDGVAAVGADQHRDFLAVGGVHGGGV